MEVALLVAVDYCDISEDIVGHIAEKRKLWEHDSWNSIAVTSRFLSH